MCNNIFCSRQNGHGLRSKVRGDEEIHSIFGEYDQKT